MRKPKFILLLSFTMIITLNTKCQIVPDSLKGIYVGNYFFRYDSDTIWSITPDTVFVTNIDTNGCWISCNGKIGVFNATNFETQYTFCHGNSSNFFLRFYGSDSLWINYEHISKPPPNIYLYSIKFKGKRVGKLTNTLFEKNSNDLFSIFPNPASNFINIQLGQEIKKATLNIYNIHGELKLNKEINGISPFEIDIQNLPQGIYLINILSKNKICNLKFIKE
jgi:hypothetical protein